jgi:hypothetical protein
LLDGRTAFFLLTGATGARPARGPGDVQPDDGNSLLESYAWLIAQLLEQCEIFVNAQILALRQYGERCDLE